MRRSLLLLALATGLGSPAGAQSGRVSVELGLDEPQRGRAPLPVVSLRNLVGDARWIDALDRSLPIVVGHRLELWRSREGWIDELVRSFEWQVIVTKEPLQEEYAVTVILAGSRPQRPTRFTDRDSALAHLQRPTKIDLTPSRGGRYYYTLAARLTALTDADMDQLERFLAGEQDLEISDRGGTAVGRAVRRFLLRIAGLPSEVLVNRSAQFVVEREED
jgi:hypothetical protein